MKPCDDFLRMIPLNETRVCDHPRCNAYTWWGRPKQTKKGTCGDHFPGAWAPSTPQLDMRAIENILRVFPGATIGTYTVEHLPPNTYVGPDAGPCVRCKRRIRRYGPFAATHCADCWARREKSSR